MKQFIRPLLLILGVIGIDQALKIWVKTNMMLGEEIPMIGNWFIIHFTENNGMAFGMELGVSYGKLILSIFRIVAVGGIAYYLYKIIKEKAPNGLIAAFSLIFAGAIGNIIDSVFYGKIFGYQDYLHGRVVDMFYFPLLRGTYPDWFPFFAGEQFEFFRPVFNFADASITVGVLIILIFQKSFFRASESTQTNSNS